MSNWRLRRPVKKKAGPQSRPAGAATL